MIVALLLLSLILFAAGRVSGRQRAKVLATPVARADRLGTGRVSLHGRAHGDPPQQAPITGRPSAYWEAELWDTRYGRNRLPSVKEQSDARVIWLEDGSGRVPVLLRGVEWVFGSEDEFVAGQTLPAAGAAFVQRCGYEWDSGKVRLRERRLEEGQRMYVLGVGTTVAEVIRAVDGVQNAALARTVASLTAMSQARDRSGEPFDFAGYLRSRFAPEDRIVWGERQALVIGTRAPEEVASRLQFMARVCNAAGTALLALAVGLSFAS